MLTGTPISDRSLAESESERELSGSTPGTQFATEGMSRASLNMKSEMQLVAMCARRALLEYTSIISAGETMPDLHCETSCEMERACILSSDKESGSECSTGKEAI